MYSPRLYKYGDSYGLYKPTVHTFGTVTIHTLFWYLKTFKIYLYLKTLTVLFINKGNRQ